MREEKLYDGQEPEEERGITRRSLLVGMGLGAAGIAATMAGCAPAAQAPAGDDAQADAVTLKEPDETIDTDIVICGSGMGGMSAAVTAAEEGAKVVVLEKQSILGGGSNVAEGVFGMGTSSTSSWRSSATSGTTRWGSSSPRAPRRTSCGSWITASSTSSWGRGPTPPSARSTCTWTIAAAT